MNVAYNLMSEGKNGVFFSFELGELKVFERFMMRTNQMTLPMLDKLSNKKLKEAILKEQEGWGQLRIAKYPTKGATIRDVEAYVMSLDYAPDYIVLDYLMEVRPTNPSEPRRLQLAEIARDARAMGERFEVPILSAWQANRDSTKYMQGSEMTDQRLIEGGVSIAECVEAVGIADIVVTINRDAHDIKNNLMRLWISESRVGESKGKCILFSAQYDRQLLIELKESVDVIDEGESPEEVIDL